ncbi:MAG: phenylacetate-CoA ligase [Parcubacteria group bacterium Gr01-1014_66]|nr:MAG: phenylacetate-CoA ligase [Parcubacteria group bacterium Gr01-1014_66]
MKEILHAEPYGFKQARAVLENARKTVPAYQKFLHAHHANAHIKTYANWHTLPICDKKSYILRYPLNDLFPGGLVPPMAYASSGSSGKPTFWFRGDLQEEHGGIVHERIIRDIFGIKKHESTLVIVCFAMGVWIAGNYTLASFRAVARRGYKVTVATPGIEMGDIMNTLHDLVPSFQHLIIAGYPPFVMDVFQEAAKRHIVLPKSTYVLTAGDKFSEIWRDGILEQIPGALPHHIISIYGSADAGVLGHETHLSIVLRRRAAKNRELFKELFGDASNLPGLVQYDPEHVFFEEENGELIFTTATAAPLIRYNIHDIGAVFNDETIKNLMDAHGLLKNFEPHKNRFKNFPFLTLKGRNDVAVTFYALNIFPEHIIAGLQHVEVRRMVSGNFAAYTHERKHGKNQELYILVELARGVRSFQRTSQELQSSIVDALMRRNIEFRKLYSIMGARALPHIRCIPFGDSRMMQRKGLINTQGKKPKIRI